MGIEFEFVDLNLIDRSLILGALYRQSLIHMGMSPDMHVYDLDYDYLLSKDNIHSRFLVDVIDFYLQLDEFESKVFICQVLEAGRYFPFWWMSYIREESRYKELYLDTLKRIDSHFHA